MTFEGGAGDTDGLRERGPVRESGPGRGSGDSSPPPPGLPQKFRTLQGNRLFTTLLKIDPNR